MKHLELTITGKVQGVCFRSQAQALAEDLGLTGYIENNPDGSVHLEAEGTDKDLEKLLDWSYRGPDLAEVKHVEVLWSDRYCGYCDFSIHE